MKKILVLANGGREHAVVKAIKRSPQQTQVFNFANANNPGIAKLAEKVEICTDKNFGEENGFEQLKKFAQENQVDFAYIGPDDPIGAGAADALLEVGVKSVAPIKSLARLESSKGFTRDLLEKYNIPGNPRFKNFGSMEGVREFCEQLDAFVVKDDGLCGGKGVSVMGDHFDTLEEGLQIAEEIVAQKTGGFVIEEKLIGVEFSAMYFADGNSIAAMPIIADHKRAFEGDKGPNTGGMGTISYPGLLPFITEQNIKDAEDITMQVMKALEKECGEKFHGIMYGGFIRTKNGTSLIEYNARLGDPEALNAMPLLESDFVEICEGVVNENLSEKEVKFANKATVCKYVVPEGYPTNPAKNVPIEFDEAAVPEGVEVFFASVDEKDGDMILKGSRAIGFVGIADTIEDAARLSEEGIKTVKGPVFHRKDIGTEGLLKDRMDLVAGF